jgi:hypothetical protein
VNVGTTSCGNCHSDPPPLVDAADPKVHNGCSSCHNSDYSRKSLAIGKTFAAGGDCTTCHTDPFATVHPDSVDHSALVTVGATSCGNCHISTLLVDPVDPKVHDGCTTCHDSEGALVGLAVGKSFAAGGDCSTCHTDPFATVHPADTDHSAIVTTGGTQCGTCHSNPPPLVDADPAISDDPKVHDSCSSCHDTDGGLINLAADKSAPGNCNTCHGADFTVIHPATIDHTALVTVGTTSCGNCHSDPPPLVDPVDHKVHDACTTCHTQDGVLVSLAVGKSFAAGGDCSTCHTDPFATVHPDTVDHSLAIQLSFNCAGCHSNTQLVDPDDPTVHDSCVICHDIDGALINLAADNTSPNECITCHGENLSSRHNSHTAILGSEYVLVWDAGTHDSAMVGDGEVYMACQTCHTADVGLLHANQCAMCHPSPVDSLGSWAGGCQQGGCHETRHEEVTVGHGSVGDQCTQCHGQYEDDYPPLPSSCANCHAVYNSSDTELPVTTSNAQPIYVVPISIDFTITDGGMVGVGQTFSLLDGEDLQVGSSRYIDTTGSHSMEFWSVDQAGNEEWPHNTVDFFIAGDTEPPVTTSTAQATTYYDPVAITLTATDNSYRGPKTTYYRINGGPVQTGTYVYIPEPEGTLDYILEYWSDDWSDNVESVNAVEFTIAGGTGTIRLVWGNSDITGSPCTAEPDAAAAWTIVLDNGVEITGSATCPGWSGYDDVEVPIRPESPGVHVDWYDSYYGYWDQSYFSSAEVPISAHGDYVRLSY